MNLPPQVQQQELNSAINSAIEHVRRTNQNAVQASVDIAKERTLYFEKIALAGAGAIALVVSFVGSHASRLQPPWLLRASLVLLFLSMFAAMFRNWQYPFYLVALHDRQRLSAKREQLRAARDYKSAFPALVLEHDGSVLPLQQYLNQFDKNDKSFVDEIEKCQTRENRAFTIVKYAENAALLLIVTGMAALIALAWANF
jgi:hypothetical protein